MENQVDSPTSAHNLSILQDHWDAAILGRGSHFSSTEKSQRWGVSPDLPPCS